MNKSVNVDAKDMQETVVNSLIAELTCNDVVRCQKARNTLVSIGKPAVALLINALKLKKGRVKWEATKALGQIADPSATTVLLKALEDEEFEIRWLAAEGLIAIGKDMLVPLLEALGEHSDSIWFRNGAHRVLVYLASNGFYDTLLPVLVALDSPQASIEVPLAVNIALNMIGKK